MYVHIFQDVFLPKLLHMIKKYANICDNRGKNREHTKIELMNLEGGVNQKCTSFLRGVVKSVRL